MIFSQNKKYISNVTLREEVTKDRIQILCYKNQKALSLSQKSKWTSEKMSPTTVEYPAEKGSL